jgi:transposase
MRLTVEPYVKRQKNDAADAEAICEAVTRANMRFVATKMPEQQSCLMLHRTRHLFIRPAKLAVYVRSHKGRTALGRQENVSTAAALENTPGTWQGPAPRG